MKRSLFRLLTSCLSIVCDCHFRGVCIWTSQTLPFNYRVEYSEILNDLSLRISSRSMTELTMAFTLLELLLADGDPPRIYLPLRGLTVF